MKSVATYYKLSLLDVVCCNAGPTSGRVCLLRIPSQAEEDGCRVHEEIVIGEPVPPHPPHLTQYPYPASPPPPRVPAFLQISVLLYFCAC